MNRIRLCSEALQPKGEQNLTLYWNENASHPRSELKEYSGQSNTRLKGKLPRIGSANINPQNNAIIILGTAKRHP